MKLLDLDSKEDITLDLEAKLTAQEDENMMLLGQYNIPSEELIDSLKKINFVKEECESLSG